MQRNRESQSHTPETQYTTYTLEMRMLGNLVCELHKVAVDVTHDPYTKLAGSKSSGFLAHARPYTSTKHAFDLNVVICCSSC